MATLNQDNRPFVGITAVIAGLFVFSLQDVIIKLFSAEYSILQGIELLFCQRPAASLSHGFS